MFLDFYGPNCKIFAKREEERKNLFPVFNFWLHETTARREKKSLSGQQKGGSTLTRNRKKNLAPIQIVRRSGFESESRWQARKRKSGGVQFPGLRKNWSNDRKKTFFSNFV
jgi:hypothetical protein